MIKKNNNPWRIAQLEKHQMVISGKDEHGDNCTIAIFDKDYAPIKEHAVLIEMAPYNAARVKTLEKKVRQLQKELRETKALAVFAAKNDIPTSGLYS